MTLVADQKILTCEANVAKFILMSKCVFSICKFNFTKMSDNKVENLKARIYKLLKLCLNIVITFIYL